MIKTGKSLLVLLFLISGLVVSAQSYIDYDSVSDNVIFRKEWSGGLILHTGGWGITFRKGIHSNVDTKCMWEADLVGMKTAKEVKTQNPYSSYAKPFVWGKINYLYIFRAGYGFHHLLNRKPYWGGVELRYFYSAGLSVGITRPVYLYVLDTVTGGLKSVKFDPNKSYSIYGRGPYGEGFDELKFYPGIYAKSGLSFDFGSYNRFVKCLEVGGTLDFYPKSIKLMDQNPAKNVFVSLYLSLSLGKRDN